MINLPEMIVNIDDHSYSIKPLKEPIEIYDYAPGTDIKAHITHRIIDNDGDVCYMFFEDEDEIGEHAFSFGYFPFKGHNVFMMIDDELILEILDTVIYLAAAADIQFNDHS